PGNVLGEVWRLKAVVCRQKIIQADNDDFLVNEQVGSKAAYESIHHGHFKIREMVADIFERVFQILLNFCDIPVIVLYLFIKFKEGGVPAHVEQLIYHSLP